MIFFPRSLAEMLLDSAERRDAKLAKQMPTQADAIRLMQDAYYRLTRLGWNDIVYCPKDGTVFSAIQASSVLPQDCLYYGDWPNGRWFILDDGDAYPCQPVLFKLKPSE